MLIPLYGFLRGDTVGLLVLAQHDDTVQSVAASLQQAATVRVRPSEAADVYYLGRRLPPEATVQEVGLKAFERIDVVQVDPDGT